MAPKRSLFSLNLSSDVEHQHISEHNPNGVDRVRIFDTPSNNPSSNNTTNRRSLDNNVSRAFGNLVNRTVNEVLEDQGHADKKVTSIEGDVYTSSRSNKDVKSETEYHSTIPKNSHLAIKNKSKRRAIEHKYDTSEL